MDGVSAATRTGRWRPHPEVVSQAMGEEIVLVHLETHRIYTFNRTGARFWDLLAAGFPRQEIQARMLQEFEIGPESLAREVDDLMVALNRGRLIRDESADAG